MTAPPNLAETILQAETRWRAQWANHERLGTAHTQRAEQQAWDAYTELCNKIDQCQQPGCDATVPEYAYCSRHRA
ncbi:hypothetical protein BKG82_26775 [Mycobacteroides chelonae]|uniref:Uncharacterized protein n=1 Tax=Mycobacteroides chelonae TaxID=1774 RepID=A0A1S1LG49_MYCCH|nr:hypothetical protein [Mycobacteroides chelonae]OHU47261.1 hypothetical protein BKG82_26775 [Mycobacteroides chelonae]